MIPKRVLFLAAILAVASAEFYDYSVLQTSLNGVATQAEKDLQAVRISVSELVLATTDEMITYATDSLAEGGNDPKAPMIGACTLYPTNYLNYYTKEVNAKIAEAQAQVNSMKYGVLKGLVNQPIISEPAKTFAKVQEEIASLTSSWPAIKTAIDVEVEEFRKKVTQLVLDMQECIRIAEES